jgi:hypothetical protein
MAIFVARDAQSAIRVTLFTLSMKSAFQNPRGAMIAANSMPF